MTQYRHLLLLSFFSLLTITASRVGRADVLIDSFTTAPRGVPLTEPGGKSNFIFNPNTGGKYFSLGLLAVSPPAGESVTVSFNENGTPYLQYTSTAQASGQFTLYYGATPPSSPIVGSGPSPLDLIVNNASDYLELHFLAFNYAGEQNTSLTTYIYQNNVNRDPNDPITSSIAQALTSSGAQTVDVPLTDFQGTKIDFISFNFVMPSGTSFKLDSISLITSAPEPSTLAMILGVPSFFLLVRRKAIISLI